MESQPIYATRKKEVEKSQAPGTFDTKPKAAKGIAVALGANAVSLGVLIGIIHLFTWSPTVMFRLFIGAALLGCAVLFARECRKATALGWRITGATMVLLIAVLVANIWGVLP